MRLRTWTAWGLLLALTPAAHAQTTVSRLIDFDFDAASVPVPDGTVINATYGSEGVTFIGEGGPFSTSVQVVNAAAAGVNFVTPANVLDGTTSSAVDVFFSPLLYPNGVSFFSIYSLADPAGFGVINAVVSFYGAGNTLLATRMVNQTQDASFFINQSGIRRVVLPADAYYDNLTFRGVLAAAPEPGEALGLGLGLAGLTCLGLRRRIRQA